jgi:hypothetical protein
VAGYLPPGDTHAHSFGHHFGIGNLKSQAAAFDKVLALDAR